MSLKRIVSTSFWTDSKVDMFSPEDKYFMLYLITNPHTTQLGIYEFSIKHAAFEMGYSNETVSVLLDRFSEKYGIIKYSKETREIAIKNYLKHSIVKGGKPVFDCLKKELSQVKSVDLVKFIVEANQNSENATVAEFINYAKNIYNIYIYKENDNDNDNERIVPRIVDSDADAEKNKFECQNDLGKCADFYQENIGTLPPHVYVQMQEWLKTLPADVIILSMQAAVDNGKRTWSYVKAILKRCKDTGIKSSVDWKNAEERHQKSKKSKNNTNCNNSQKINDAPVTEHDIYGD